jgi:hypothetical protein
MISWVTFAVVPSYQAAAEKMVQAFMERNSELQALRQYLGGKELMTSSQTFISNQPAGVTSIGPHHGEQTDQVRTLDSDIVMATACACCI